MTKKTLVVGLLAMFSVTTFAQTAAKKIKAVRTQPDLYYLQDGQQASSLELLPAPPQPGSIQFLYDQSLSLRLSVLRLARRQLQRFINLF